MLSHILIQYSNNPNAFLTEEVVVNTKLAIFPGLFLQDEHLFTLPIFSTVGHLEETG
jgi:hypothetical protein